MKNNKKQKVILVGKGGSGKDYLRKFFETIGSNYCKSYTTRPIREEEIDGEDYIFIKEDQIPSKKDLYESVYFNGWFYGTLKKDFEECNLFIMTPKGISSLKKKDREKCIIILIDADEESRRSRLSLRKDADDVERRINADEEDFRDFDDFDIRINNSQSTESDILNYIDNGVKNLY